jgi:S-adenosylmethionine-diacylgycerolhomoserine-N-methlytransferase
MTSSSSALSSDERHRRFLNAYYGGSRHFYDLTRKYYLFGRDRALRELAGERWRTLVEIGPGTGRNLRILRRLKPDARLGGIEASDAMLEHARARCPWATLVQGFAERADLATIHGERPDRVLFSYCLSMVEDSRAALARARASVAPGGEVVVIDFADMWTMPSIARAALRAWVGAYHVTPLSAAFVEDCASRVEYGPWRYFALARYAACD